MSEALAPESPAVDVPDRIETDRPVPRPFCKSDAGVLHEALAELLVALREFLWSLAWVARGSDAGLGQTSVLEGGERFRSAPVKCNAG